MHWLKKPIVWIIGLLIPVAFAAELGNQGNPPAGPQAATSTRTYFAKVAEDGTVLDVIVADQNFINSGAVGDPAQWLETAKRETPKARFNPAFKGEKYDREKGAFLYPRPDNATGLDPKTFEWIVPTATSVE